VVVCITGISKGAANRYSFERETNEIFFNRAYILFLSITILFFGIKISFANDGLIFEDKYLHPGKADFHYRHTLSTDEYNTIWWSPSIKGGWGTINTDGTGATNYVGGYIRPLTPKDGRGELILGFYEIDTASSNSHEFQGEYRFPFGLGIGGGSVARKNGGSDVEFGKLSFRNKNQDWNWILETQYQEIGAEESFGGYIAAYNEQFMFTYGNDGEQWRSAFGYISSETEALFRPALETLFVDNRIGAFDGSRFLFINATLKFKGGFLSHPARLGRAMGPTGIEFGNPLGFLGTAWNRRLDPWELGAIGDYRLVRTKTAAGSVTERHEALIYPFQFDKSENIFDKFYIGGFNAQTNGDNSLGVLGGFFGKVTFLQVSIGADFNIDTNERRIFVGIIDKF